MKIGIDLTPLQGPHRLRGTGSLLINLMNNIPAQFSGKNEFVLYAHKEHSKHEAVSQYLDIKELKHTIRYVAEPNKYQRLRKVRKLYPKLKEFIFGDQRLYDTSDLDAFIQINQNRSLPRTEATKYLFVLDIIPFIIESPYLRGYKASRTVGHNRVRSLKNLSRRLQYILQIKNNCRKADMLIAISEHTKKDFINKVKVKPSKITVTPLGADVLKNIDDNIELRPFHDTSWGSFRNKPTSLEDTKYILYIGGVDPRRRIVDLLAAFNNLRARGEDIKLVLAGDILTSLFALPDLGLRDYTLRQSYNDDIMFMGFVSEQEKAWLYKHALAVVYPSVYEGFGLPVLEAMKYGTPIICYNNSSIPEVGGDAALYAENLQDIVSYLTKLIHDKKYRDRVVDAGLKQSSNFSWEKTAKLVFEAIERN